MDAGTFKLTSKMKVQSVLVGLAVFIVVTTATPSVLVDNKQGHQYYLTPGLSRQRRAEGFGQGGANGHRQSGQIGFTKPNGSGGSVSYGHVNGYGHNVGVDGRVPVWSSKNRFGESTLNVGGGVTQRFGGPGGSQILDKRVGFNFNHQW